MYYERERKTNTLGFDFISPITSVIGVGAGMYAQQQQKKEMEKERKKQQIAAREAAIAQARQQAEAVSQAVQQATVEEVVEKGTKIKYALIAVGTVAAVISVVFAVGAIKRKRKS